MGPFRSIVTGPNGGGALGTRKGRPGQNEGPEAVVAPQQMSLVCGGVEEHPIQIVDFSVLNTQSGMNAVFLHGNFRPIEHRGLIHVIPSKSVQSGSFVSVQLESFDVMLPGIWVRHVEVRRGPGPTPAVKNRAIFVLDVVIQVVIFFVEEVVVVPLYVGVNDGHQLPAFGHQLVGHVYGVRELVVIPREVPLAISVFDVQPHHVHRDVMFVEVAVDGEHVLLVIVIPTALMVGQGEEGRQVCGACN